MSVENLLIHQPARYGQQVTSEAEWSYARANHLRLLEVGDVSEVAHDESLVTAVRAGDANLVGKVLLAAVNAYLDRLADRSVGINPRDWTSEDAAAEALQADLAPVLRASIEQLVEKR